MISVLIAKIVNNSKLTWVLISSSIAILSGFVSQKLYGIYLGPTGLAYVGNLNNITNVFILLGTAGQVLSTTLHSARYKSSPRKLKLFLFQVHTLSLWSGGMSALALILVSFQYSDYLLGEPSRQMLLMVAAVGGVALGQATLLAATVNGQGKLKQYSLVQILTTLFGMSIRIPLTIYWGTEGAMWSLILPNFFMLLCSGVMAQKNGTNHLPVLRCRVGAAHRSAFVNNAVISLVSVGIIHISQLVIRGRIIGQVSIESAGYYQSVIALSQVYNTVIITAFASVYTPLISSIKSLSALRSKVSISARFIFVIGSVLAIPVVFLSDWIIVLFYSSAFLPAATVMTVVVLGDVLKVTSWAFGYLTTTFAKTRVYVISELTFHLSYIALSFYLVNYYGIMGVAWAYACSYAIYLLIYIYLFYFTHLLNPDNAHFNYR